VVAVTTAVRPASRSLGSPRTRSWVRATVGSGILIAIVLEVGAEPFIRGLAAVSVVSAVAAVVLGAAATSAAAWRWRILAGRLGLALEWGASMSAYYRSQFLNSVLPGGVVGDVHRAVAHGRAVSTVPQASRAVVAERMAGQAVQLVLAAVVLVSIGMSAYAPAVGIVVLAVAVACVGLIVAAAVSARARIALRRELATFRFAFGSPGTVVKVFAASLVVILGHVATFIVACIAVGVEASPPRLAAVALIAVLAGSIPLNVGGWGPREGVAAWAFAAAGLGATAGIAASTAFGVLALIAVAPGAAVVAASALHRRRIALGEETTA
jgi:uncharacterized membrane protein YbhN (UPF0104 family)